MGGGGGNDLPHIVVDHHLLILSALPTSAPFSSVELLSNLFTVNK